VPELHVGVVQPGEDEPGRPRTNRLTQAGSTSPEQLPAVAMCRRRNHRARGPSLAWSPGERPSLAPVMKAVSALLLRVAGDFGRGFDFPPPAVRVQDGYVS
jgi:hypothetical protein